MKKLLFSVFFLVILGSSSSIFASGCNQVWNMSPAANSCGGNVNCPVQQPPTYYDGFCVLSISCLNNQGQCIANSINYDPTHVIYNCNGTLQLNPC